MVPRGHSAHSFDPRAGATDPGAHASQNDVPRYGEAVPTAHDAQLCAFFPTEYVPTSQRAHTRTAAEGADDTYEPGAQSNDNEPSTAAPTLSVLVDIALESLVVAVVRYV